MFLASVFSSTQAYSSKKLAEEAVATFLLNNHVHRLIGIRSDIKLERFILCYKLERYSDALVLWNSYVDSSKYGITFYKARVFQTEIDKDFC